MRHSIYIRLATVLLTVDLKREEREWRRSVRRLRSGIPWENAHLLRDIGLDTEGRPVGTLAEPPAVTAQRRARHLRRLVRSRILT